MDYRPANFPDLFFHQAQKLGKKTALRHKDYGIWNRISWEQYGQSVREAAAGYLSLGVEPGDRIAILGENRPEWLICHLAAMAAAGVTCGIYPTSSSEEIEYVVEHSESKILFVENEEQVDKVLQIIDKLHVKQVVIWDPQGLWGFSHPRFVFYDALVAQGRQYLEKHPQSLEVRMGAIKKDDIAMMIYTSGTTGRPKGAMISHGNILFLTESFSHVIEYDGNDELLSYLPLAHIYENLISVFFAVWSGCTVNFVESLDTLALNLREISPTFFASVPRLWEKFVSMIEIKMSDSTFVKRAFYKLAISVGLKRMRTPKSSAQHFWLNLAYWFLYWGLLYHLKRQVGMERMRFAVCAAAPASPELFEWYNAIGVPLREGYGQTESTGVIALQYLDRPRLGYVGEAIPGVEIKIAEDGEILARGKGVFKGYFKQEELTRETIQDGWLYTGDVGALKDGFLKILDRKKDIMITRGGKNITPAFIENKLKFSIYIQDAVVVGDGRKYLTALILIDEDNVNKYAQDQAIPFTTFEDLTKNSEIIKLIGREVDKVNDTLARVETIKKFRLLPRRFYAEDGDVTPTQKVKRRMLEKTYEEMIESMY
jgi:long-chain acyl-CoA synthetase